MSNIQEEIWKDVVGYEGIYRISNFGCVQNSKGKTLRQHIIKGYPSHTLFKDKNGKSFYLHRLLLISFIPNPENLPQVNHKNGIITDYNLNNLEWCSSSHNQKHAYKMGLKSRMLGEKHPKNKLTIDQVLEIRSSSGIISHRAMAKKYGVSKTQISWIINGKSWAHLLPLDK